MVAGFRARKEMGSLTNLGIILSIIGVLILVLEGLGVNVMGFFSGLLRPLPFGEILTNPIFMGVFFLVAGLLIMNRGEKVPVGDVEYIISSPYRAAAAVVLLIGLVLLLAGTFTSFTLPALLGPVWIGRIFTGFFAAVILLTILALVIPEFRAWVEEAAGNRIVAVGLLILIVVFVVLFAAIQGWLGYNPLAFIWVPVLG